MILWMLLLCCALVHYASSSFSGDWATEKWDMIVVGAGPAGIIVADRMSEAGLKTLLIEGGGASYGILGGDLSTRRPKWLDGTNLTRVDVPGLYKSIFADGGGLTCGSVVNGYGGCTVGGSSAINAGLFFEPPSSDFDLYFPQKWKSADMKPAIQRLYSMQPSTNLISMNGIRYLQSGYDAVRRWIVDGLKFSDIDINAQADKKTMVFGYPVFDYSNGQRGGPVVTYLQKALGRDNFHLQTNTRVIRAERTGSRATGVIVSINGTDKLIQISSTGRVVFSGGALQSPALLMFSGIGPPETLQKLESAGKLSPSLRSSDWINSTAVGDGLFDNPNTFIELEGPDIKSYSYSYDNPPLEDKSLYLEHRSGSYTFASQTSVFWDTVARPDGSVAAFQGTVDSSGFGQFTSNKTITLNICGTSGLKSHGKVILDQKFIPGPDDKIYYSNPQDAQDISSFIFKLLQGIPGSGLTSLNIPPNSTREQIERYITTPSLYARGKVNHWSSSCRIGACVDVNTRVVGMENLHVVDASIVAPLSVNPQFGVMVVAERASELILGLEGRRLGDDG